MGPFMNRRKFIKNSALAAALVGISPALSADSNMPGSKKKFIFIFRGVTYIDAFNSFKKFNITSDLSFHIQKVACMNQTFTHQEGFNSLMEKKSEALLNEKFIESQNIDRYTIPEIMEDAFTKEASGAYTIYMHHTEIGHSSTKMYIEKLEEFFAELGKYYQPAHHKIIVTADIGRNELTNSCGGKDHSNSTCLETFALYLGGKASKLSEKTTALCQKEVLNQKF